MANRIGGIATAVKAYIDSAIAVVVSLSTVRYDAGQGLTATQAGQARANIGAQAALGFTPVAQGLGADQSQSHSVQLGLGVSVNRLKASIDGGDFGSIWTDRDCSFSKGGAGFHVAPSGLILQWATLPGGGGDPTWTFPMTFPNACFGVFGNVIFGGDNTRSFGTSAPTKSSVACHPRYVSYGGYTGVAGEPMFVYAIGY